VLRIDGDLAVGERQRAAERLHGFLLVSRSPAIRIRQTAPEAVIRRVQLDGLAIELARVRVAPLHVRQRSEIRIGESRGAELERLAQRTFGVLEPAQLQVDATEIA